MQCSLVWSQSRNLLALILILVTTSCGVVGERGTTQSGSNEYIEATELDRMEVPEGLDSESIVDLYPVPGLSDEADDTLIDPDNLPIPTPLTLDVENQVQLQTLAGDYWVLVKSPPSQVWARLKQHIENQNLMIVNEQAANGLVVARYMDKPSPVYAFLVTQGLQPKSAQLRVRVTQDQPYSFPVASVDKQVEINALEDLTIFMSRYTSQTAYSYAALGISSKKRLTVKSSKETGLKVIYVDEKASRTKASLKQALLISEYDVLDYSDGSVTARYLPQLDEEEQPGFFLRLFGVGPKEFDEDIEYGGETYQFYIKTLSPDTQQLSVQKPNAQWTSESAKKRELNAILMQVKRALY